MRRNNLIITRNCRQGLSVHQQDDFEVWEFLKAGLSACLDRVNRLLRRYGSIDGDVMSDSTIAKMG